MHAHIGQDASVSPPTAKSPSPGESHVDPDGGFLLCPDDCLIHADGTSVDECPFRYEMPCLDYCTALDRFVEARNCAYNEGA